MNATTCPAPAPARCRRIARRHVRLATFAVCGSETDYSRPTCTAPAVEVRS